MTPSILAPNQDGGGSTHVSTPAASGIENKTANECTTRKYSKALTVPPRTPMRRAPAATLSVQRTKTMVEGSRSPEGVSTSLRTNQNPDAAPTRHTPRMARYTI